MVFTSISRRFRAYSVLLSQKGSGACGCISRKRRWYEVVVMSCRSIQGERCGLPEACKAVWVQNNSYSNRKYLGSNLKAVAMVYDLDPLSFRGFERWENCYEFWRLVVLTRPPPHGIPSLEILDPLPRPRPSVCRSQSSTFSAGYCPKWITLRIT